LRRCGQPLFAGQKQRVEEERISSLLASLARPRNTSSKRVEVCYPVPQHVGLHLCGEVVLYMQGVYVLPAAGASSGPFHHADTACWMVLPLTCGDKRVIVPATSVTHSLTTALRVVHASTATLTLVCECLMCGVRIPGGEEGGGGGGGQQCLFTLKVFHAPP